MNLRHIKFLYALVPLIILAQIMGCDDEDTAGNFDRPAISEVSPAQGLIGATVTITGSKLSKVTKVKFGAVDAADFNPSANSENTITVKVPAGLDAGDTKITVFYPAASETNLGPSAAADFAVLFPPVLTEVIPASAKPGKQITLSGNYLADATAVSIGDVLAVFEAKATSITVTVPEAEAGETELTVATPGGNASLPFEVLAKTPEIVGFSPAEAHEGDEITLDGFYFDDVQSVSVGGTEATEFTVVNSSRITFIVPAGAFTGKVAVTNALGTAESEGNLNVLVTIGFPVTVFSDALNGNWQKWDGWGTDVQDLANEEHPESGSKAIKISWNSGYGGFQMHPVTPSPFLLDGATKIKLSVFGGPGSDGKQMAVYIKNNGGVESTKVPITIDEGAYTVFEVTLSSLGNPANIAELNFQNWGNDPLVVFVDNIQIQ